MCCRQAGLDVDEQLSWSCLGPVLPIPIVFDVMKYSDIGVPGLIAAGYDLTRFASSTIRFRLTLPPGMACEEAYECEERFTMLMWAAALCRRATLQALVDAGKFTKLLLGGSSEVQCSHLTLCLYCEKITCSIFYLTGVLCSSAAVAIVFT